MEAVRQCWIVVVFGGVGERGVWSDPCSVEDANLLDVYVRLASHVKSHINRIQTPWIV